jgi:hypothetical protein
VWLMTQNGYRHKIHKNTPYVSWDWTLGVKVSQEYPSFSCSKLTTHCTWWMGMRYMPSNMNWHALALCNILQSYVTLFGILGEEMKFKFTKNEMWCQWIYSRMVFFALFWDAILLTSLRFLRCYVSRFHAKYHSSI